MFIFKRMKTLNLPDKALDASTQRQKVITNNIANVDAPNFKRSEVNFESELRRAIQEDCINDKLPHGKMTDTRHIPIHIPADISAVKPRIYLDYTTTTRNDGNNVDIEKDIVDASKNTMQDNAYIRRASSAFATLKRVMQTIQ